MRAPAWAHKTAGWKLNCAPVLGRPFVDAAAFSLPHLVCWLLLTPLLGFLLGLLLGLPLVLLLGLGCSYGCCWSSLGLLFGLLPALRKG